MEKEYNLIQRKVDFSDVFRIFNFENSLFL